jgi:uncharacterized cupredoxin-like copper-binding protein
MKKNIPHTLLIAEDIRAEIGDKFTIVGVSHAPIRLFKAESQEHALYSIAAYGQFEIKKSEVVTIQVLGPDGEILSEGIVPVPEAEKEQLVVAGKFNNVKFSKAGKHKLIMNIDGHEFSKSFEILLETTSD